MKQILVRWHNKWESPSINPGLSPNRFQDYTIGIQIAFLVLLDKLPKYERYAEVFKNCDNSMKCVGCAEMKV